MALLHMAGLENSECVWKIQRKPEVFITISMLYKVKVWLVESFIFPFYWYYDCKCIFQEFKKENPQKFDNLPVHFGQLEFRESLVNIVLGLDSGVKHSDFKSTCISSFNETSKRLRCTFCYAHAKLNELLKTHCKTLFHCGNCNVNLCFSPGRDCFTKWHSTKGARVRAWVKKMEAIQIIKLC